MRDFKIKRVIDEGVVKELMENSCKNKIKSYKASENHKYIEIII